jgi:hypothetical protein
VASGEAEGRRTAEVLESWRGKMEDIATTSERHEAGRTIMFWMDRGAVRIAPIVLIPLVNEVKSDDGYFKVRPDYPAFIQQGSLLVVLIATSIVGFIIGLHSHASPGIAVGASALILLWLVVAIYFQKIRRVQGIPYVSERYSIEGYDILIIPKRSMRLSPDFILIPDSLKAFAAGRGSSSSEIDQSLPGLPIVTQRIDLDRIRRMCFLFEAIGALVGTAFFYLFIYMRSASLSQTGLILLISIFLVIVIMIIRLYTERVQRGLDRLARYLFGKRGKWKISSYYPKS